MQYTPFYEHMIQHLREGICFINTRQKITLWSDALVELTGFTSEELIGTSLTYSAMYQSIGELNPDENIIFPLDRSNVDQSSSSYRLVLRHKQGHRLLIDLKVIPVKDNSGLLGTIGVFYDASNHAELEATTRSMKKLMRIDPTTSLPNERSLFDSMKGEYLRFARYGTPFALIAMSIDPPANEALFQTKLERDALLKWFAQQLSVGFRKADTSGRLRGASFMALLPHTNTRAAEKAAEKIQRILESTLYPTIGIPITASFGCASISRSDTLDRLIDRAKKALKAARNDNGNQVVSL